MKENTLKPQADEPVDSFPLKEVNLNGYAAYIGLDVHKDTISISVAESGRDAPQYRGEISNDPNKAGSWLRN